MYTGVNLDEESVGLSVMCFKEMEKTKNKPVQNQVNSYGLIMNLLLFFSKVGQWVQIKLHKDAKGSFLQAKDETQTSIFQQLFLHSLQRQTNLKIK